MSVRPRSIFFVGVLAVASILAAGWAVQGQGATAPDFVPGPNVVYCHASPDSLTVWMNTLQDDGDGFPYYLFGSSTTTVPGVGAGVDPVVNQEFETRIPLTPVSSQGLVIGGTVTVRAYIGGGTYTAGNANIGTSLAAGGAELGAAAEKMHRMTPAQAGETYNAIDWTFDIPETTLAAGTTLEWVISGTVQGGNNVFLACHEARGRSNIEVPVTSASAGAGSSNSTSSNSTSSTVFASNSTSGSGTNTTSLSSTGPSTSGNTTGNRTAGNGTADEQGTPAPPVAFAGLAVFAAALVVRRRLR